MNRKKEIEKFNTLTSKLIAKIEKINTETVKGNVAGMWFIGGLFERILEML